MSQTATFGRRRPVTTPSLAPDRPALPLDAVEDPLALNQAAEAFRSELQASSRPQHSEFAVWRRGRRGRRLVAWTLRLALVAPGLVCLALQTPWWVSGGLELTGLGVGAWLRYERRRHLKEIAEWSSDPC